MQFSELIDNKQTVTWKQIKYQTRIRSKIIQTKICVKEE